MNLDEYLNQKNPKKMPRVFLKKDEYSEGLTTKTSMGDTKTQIFIHAFPGIEYSVTNKRGSLYTTDSDGNQMKMSCFNI